MSLQSILIPTLLFVAACFGSCGTQGDPAQQIRAFEAAIDTAPPTLEQTQTLTAMYLDYADAHPEDHERTPEFLSSAAELIRKQGLPRRAAVLDIRCIRDYFTSPATPERLTTAAVSITGGILKYPPTDTLLNGLKAAFPSQAELEATLSTTLESIKAKAAAATTGAEQQQRFLEYASLSEVAALLIEEPPKAPQYFSEAAKTYHSLEAFSKALQLYDWMTLTYPNSEDGPRSFFMKAYILETLGQLDQAQNAYRLFLTTYPNDQLSDAARASLDNLGKTPEQIVSEFQ